MNVILRALNPTAIYRSPVVFYLAIEISYGRDCALYYTEVLSLIPLLLPLFLLYVLLLFLSLLNRCFCIPDRMFRDPFCIKTLNHIDVQITLA